MTLNILMKNIISFVKIDYLYCFRYFTRPIFQFQFLEALCEVADPGAPMHRCDISQSKEAGQLLSSMLELGSSLPWQDALEKLTGTREMSVKSFLKFFEPLENWLEEANAINGDKPGWSNKYYQLWTK